MNKGIVKLICVVTVIASLTGCSGMATQGPEVVASKSILSGAEAQSMIQVSVTIIEPSPQEMAPDSPTVAALTD
ncbi:MAG: hypothetical protein AAFN50_08450 [Pseudomonadota bacterium]